MQRGHTRVQRGDADVTQAEAMPHQDDKSLPEAIAAATATAAWSLRTSDWGAGLCL